MTLGSLSSNTVKSIRAMKLATQLFEMYEQNGGELTQKSFGSSLRRRGFESVRITKGCYKGHKAWKGLRILGLDFSEFPKAKA